MWTLFYGAIFTSFGLGITLALKTKLDILDGIAFITLGFILLIIAVIIGKKLNEVKTRRWKKIL